MSLQQKRYMLSLFLIRHNFQSRNKKLKRKKYSFFKKPREFLKKMLVSIPNTAQKATNEKRSHN